MKTILVVENSRHVREPLGELLRHIGYSVLLTESGEEAMVHVKAYTGEIHLLLANVFLPGLNGPQVADYFTVTRPEMKVLFLSSSSYQDLIGQGIQIPESLFLQKPVVSEALADKLREVLG